MILRTLFLEQKTFDEYIAAIFSLSFDDTRKDRLLALIVELGELTNAGAAFKYWKRNKAINKERLLDEFADVLHFALSFGWMFELYDYDFEPKAMQEATMTEISLSLFKAATEFVTRYDVPSYLTFFETFLGLAIRLGLTDAEITTAYHQKLAVNYQRQKEHY
ncbi:MAG: dUTP diphosphatase [Erysipelotrichaceae bacterium]|jgi:dimeric dUTPase (all-alpha-NTP-PPase superfamily)|nr:dUTP diphosphatase [Erysipelotrichaceae bacterium]